MKLHGARFEISAVAAGLTVVMAAVMWARQPQSTCEMPVEPVRHLVLSRDTDREHLARDVSVADRTARRFSGSTASAAEQRARFVECEGRLVEQIAATHNLPPDTVRPGGANAE